MARPTQAFDGKGRRVFRWPSPRVFAVLATALALSACGTKGFSIDSAIDDSIVTSSVSQQPGASAGTVVQASDEMTIRNAVSSAIVDEIGDTGIGWANAYTGSRGAIREISETRDQGLLCRRFTASRESFSGVHLYRGETCLGAAQLWMMRRFERME